MEEPPAQPLCPYHRIVHGADRRVVERNLRHLPAVM
jgi:hypothetical protein